MIQDTTNVQLLLTCIIKVDRDGITIPFPSAWHHERAFMKEQGITGGVDGKMPALEAQEHHCFFFFLPGFLESESE